MEQADKDIAKAREEEPLIEQQTKRALEDYTLQGYENKILEKAITLQKQTGLTDLRELTRFYTQYQQSWKRHTLLTTFEKELQQKDLLDSFLHSEWTKGYEAGLQAFLPMGIIHSSSAKPCRRKSDYPLSGPEAA